MRRASLVIFLAAFFIAPALADIRILASPGGEVGQFVRLFSVVGRLGERVIIDGPCFSACTLVLSAVPYERICVTRRAILGFHAPRLIDRNGNQYDASEYTPAVTAAYPPAVQAWINRHGGLRSKLILLRGRELAELYPRCR